MISVKKAALKDILKASKSILTNEEGITSLEHRLHTRIYNNAFANLMMEGIPVEENGKDLVFHDKECFRCPMSSIQTILRDQYDAVVERCKSKHVEGDNCSLESEGDLYEAQDCAAMVDVFDHMVLPDAEEDSVDVSIHTDEEEEPERHNGKIREVHFSSIYKRDAETDTEEDGVVERENDFSVKSLASPQKRLELKTQSQLQNPKGKRRTFFLGKRNKTSADYSVSDESSNEEKFSFRPKTIDIEMVDVSRTYEEIPYEKPGEKEYVKPISRDTSHDGGELLMQRHMVTLSKRLGTEIIGPYRFTFWPTSVPATDNRIFADMLVHLVDDVEKSEQLYVLDRNKPEITINFDKKKLKVFGLWEEGEFTAHIVPVDRTASMYEIKDDCEDFRPDVVDDTFLEQFRLEKKGQPKHFVVPFRENNHGEQNIPIIGYVESKGIRHALKRMNGNTLRYSMDKKAKIISGRWVDGRFEYSVDTDRV